MHSSHLDLMAGAPHKNVRPTISTVTITCSHNWQHPETSFQTPLHFTVHTTCSTMEDATSSTDESSRQGKLVVVITALVVAATTIALWLLKKAKTATPPLPPGPRGLPILGYLPFLGTHLHKSFTELAGLYGPVYKLRLGQKLYVVVSSPSLAKQVRDHDVVFADRNPSIASRILTYGGNDIAFASYGAEWKKSRKLFVRELLSNARLDASYVLRKQKLEKAVEDLYRKRGQAVEFGQVAFMAISNTVLTMLWGSTTRGEEGEKLFMKIREATDEAMVLHGAPNVSDLIPWLARFDLQGLERKAREVLQRFDRILSSLIDKRRRQMTDGDGGGDDEAKDFLQILLDLNRHGGDSTAADSSITDNQLKGILVDAIIGGTDTTSTMVEWTMAELMQHPEEMQRVQRELDEVVGKSHVVEEFHLPKLHFLAAAVKETSRLHPALPLLVPRCPTQDCEIGGYTIPKGSTVFINAYAIHRDPLWDSPLEFRPERFLDEKAARFDYLGNNSQYFPFGTGRRACAGLPLAEKMLKYLLASLLHSFEWKLAHGSTEVDLADKFGIVVRLEKPLVLIPTPRLDNPELYYV